MLVTIGSFSIGSVIQRTSLETVTIALNETEKTIKTYLREPKIAFDNIYMNVCDMLEKNESNEALQYYFEQFADMLADPKNGITGFNNIYGFIRGEFIRGFDRGSGDEFGFQQSPWFLTASKNEDVEYTMPYTDSFTGTTVIALSKEIYGANGAYRGILAVEVNVSWLMNYTDSLQFTEGGYGIVIDKDFTTLTYPQEEYINIPLRELGDNYSRIADILEKDSPSLSGLAIKDIYDNRVIVFWQKLFNDWFIIVFIPFNKYYSDLQNSIFILVCLGILFSVVLSWILLRISKEKIRADKENRYKSSFLTRISHEMRTPMNAIIGITQIQLQNETLPDEYAEALEKINSSGSGLLGIINDLLDISKIETGKFELDPVLYDIPSFINDTVHMNILRIDSKPIEFILDINENIPSKLYGDEIRLKQILNNLLSNAIKYTEKGYVKFSINQFPQENDMVLMRFSVEDTGQGIKKEDLDRLFTEYSRFNTKTNRKIEGTGIGLNIAKNLTELMGGVITAKSEYGKGSTFSVEIKQKIIDYTLIGPETAKTLNSFSYTTRKQERRKNMREIMPYGKILIVDDVKTNLYIAEKLMEPYRLKTETADSGHEAIEKIKSGKTYDIIFMDHMMPEMDGIETTQRLRKMGYEDLIIALTANALAGNEEVFRKNGFDDFISKPIDVRFLNSLLNKYIRDRYPEEAKKYREGIKLNVLSASRRKILPAESIGQDCELFRIFCKESVKTAAVLRETLKDKNIKLFTSTVHGIKSALANIGEIKMSETAASLERAGIAGNTKFIFDYAEDFIKSLEHTAETLSSKIPEDKNAVNDENVPEDTFYLNEQLLKIKSACENYDDTAAYAAIDLLKQKKWNPAAAAMLEEIYDLLFLDSNFEAVSEKIQKFLQ
ncbi:MAG: ATP-binding protein [Oscillospiraceae bacterium]|nr:ATP-binding protein [Oscillospiraceae bacterium]